MNKNIIKNYALKLKEEDIINYCNKENINITYEEIEYIMYNINNNIDDILNGNIEYYLNSKNLSCELQDKLNSLYNKYKRFIY